VLCVGLFTASISFGQTAASHADTKGPANSIEEYLQPLIDNETLAGAVTLVANKNSTVYINAVGYRDLEMKKPMEADSLFWIASTSKPMTATALMMLVDAGKVGLDDPVEKYLPEFHGQMVSQKKPDEVPRGEAPTENMSPPIHPIRIREILSHTSGLPFKSKAQPGALDRLPLKESVRSFATEPLIFQPGTDYVYSNEGLNTAARIIEVVSGMSYERFMKERLFDPLGMKDTTFWPDSEQVKRVARSYRVDAATKKLTAVQIDQLTYPLDDKDHRFPMPAGGLFSTASDVSRFCQMILNGGTIHGRRIVSEAAISEMTRQQNGGLRGKSYGLGWSLGNGSFGHGGAYNNAMEIKPAAGRILIFMVQQDGPFGTSEGDKIMPTLERLADELTAPK
jgi:CubicO group peptidase (beta-lactamase class C family)